jgi:hypothetical protein
MTNVMHNFLIYLPIYFCLICFGLSVSPPSEVAVQFRQRYVSLNHCRNGTPASEDGLKESPKHVRSK